MRLMLSLGSLELAIGGYKHSGARSPGVFVNYEVEDWFGDGDVTVNREIQLDLFGRGFYISYFYTMGDV